MRYLLFFLIAAPLFAQITPPPSGGGVCTVSGTQTTGYVLTATNSGTACAWQTVGGASVDNNTLKNAAFINDLSVSANTITGTTATAFPGAYAKGQSVIVQVANTNTGATTININTLGAKSVTKNGATALAAGNLVAGNDYLMTYDGTEFEVLTFTVLAVDIPTLNQNTTGNAATATNLASYPTLCSGGQFSQGLSGSPLSNNCATPAGGGSSAFSAITSATNTTAAMVVGSGASMSATGSGTIAATSVPGFTAGVGTLTGPATSGTVSPTSAGNVVPQANGSGNLAIGFMPAFTGGDCTTSAGSGNISCASIGGKSVTLGAAFTTTGTSAITLAFPSSGTPTYTFPAASQTLASLAGTETLSNKTLASGTIATTQAQNDNSTKVATTAYTDLAVANAVAGVNPAVAVNAATTAAGNTSGFTYNNGVSGVGATFTGSVNTAVTIDGFTFTAVGQRLLIKNDTQSPSGAFNGIYSLTVIQTIAVAPVFTRALDYDTPSDMNNTGAIPVVSGTANGGTSWYLTSSITTVGTSPLTFTQFTLNPTTIITTSTACSGDLSGTMPGCTVAGIKSVPFCTGFTPTTGQALTYTTASSPNPCYTAATGGGTTIWTGATSPNGQQFAPTTMTSASAPSPFLVTSSYGPGPTNSQIWGPFSGNTLNCGSTPSACWGVGSTLTGTNTFLEIDLGLGNATILGSYSIGNLNSFGGLNGANSLPSALSIQGSNNNSTWTTLDSETGITWSGTAPNSFTLGSPGSTAYRYFRLYALTNSGNAYYTTIGQWLMNSPASSVGVAGDFYYATSTNTWYGPRPAGANPIWPVGIAPPVFQTNSVNNATQGLLNLIAGTNIALTNSGSGVTVAGSAFPSINGYISNGTKFTASGCSNSTLVGGATAGSYHSGTTGTCAVVITTGLTATNGWACAANDLTTNADTQTQTATTTTTATITGATVSGDVINFLCIAY